MDTDSGMVDTTFPREGQEHGQPGFGTLTKYDVFLNHRGPDLKETFVSHLGIALRRCGFEPFVDAEALVEGQHAFNSINEALSGVLVHVAIFSPRYAESKYCLNELCDMLASQKPLIPVFYDVEPENLRRTEVGPFAEAFCEHLRKGRDEDVARWKTVLLKVAAITGFKLVDCDNDRLKLEEKIVAAVLEFLPTPPPLAPARHPVGLMESSKKVSNMLCKMGDNVGVVGICGVGGIGKTTLAREVYNQEHSSFGSWCFLSDVKEAKGVAVIDLQMQMVTGLLGVDTKKMQWDSARWFDQIRRHKHKVFVVIDDISRRQQFDALVPALMELPRGSRVLITSRESGVLKNIMLDTAQSELYHVPELGCVDSLDLFLWCAFRRNNIESVDASFHEYAREIAGACCGLPLALEVMGGFLSDKKNYSEDERYWQEATLALRKNGDIMTSLQMSYDGLVEDEDKRMFLDIACFMFGLPKRVAIEVWDLNGLYASSSWSLSRLIDKCLVKVGDDGVIVMHDLLRDMGRNVVVQRAPYKLEMQSHIWHPEVAAKILQKKQPPSTLTSWWDSAAHEQSQIDLTNSNSLANAIISTASGLSKASTLSAELIILKEEDELSMTQFDAWLSDDDHSAIPDHVRSASHAHNHAAASNVSMPEIKKSIDIASQDLDATGSLELEGLDQAKSVVQDMCNTYIQSGRFEDFCSARGIHGEEMTEIGSGRLTAALFRGAFFHHVETLLMAPKSSSRAYLPHLLQEAANLVVKDLPYATKILQVGESQSFQFLDEVYDGDPVDVDVVFSLGGLVAICQKFSKAEERDLKHLETDFSIEYCIVYHDLTSTYLRRRVMTKVLQDSLIENACGVLGVEVTDEDIHLEIMRDDGSYYSGTLKDFAYPFVKIHGDSEAIDNQCATRLFGHFKGAEFLSAKEYGLKCSPLLAISLVIATQRENLALKWNMTHGHMEIGSSKHLGFEKLKWQILYTDKINELGLAVEWGMEQVMSFEMAHPQVAGTSRHSQEIQALASVFGNAVQQKRNLGLQLNLPGGMGAGGSVDIFGSEGKDLAKEAQLRIMERLWTQESKFVETSNLNKKHVRVRDDLLQGRLPDAPYNYLVVWDDANNGHVSVYWATNHGKLEWITDILLPGGKGEHMKLFRSRLKGLRMEVKRDGSKLVSTDAHKSTTDLMSRFKKKKQLTIDNSMVQVPSGSQSNDEWVHLIGPQAKYSGNKFLWEATHMRAIISSRTSYSSGAVLETFVLNDKFGETGYCIRGESNAPLVHHCEKVVACGQFSKAPASLLEGANLIKWGGLIDEHDLR